MARLLDVESINVHFGGNHAVRDVDLHVDAGSITGLIGPNGAGKTTTFNAITGLQDTSGGIVRFDGRDISKLATHQRSRLGIARTFQRLELFGSMTALENVQTAAEIRRTWSRDRTDARDAALAALTQVGLHAQANERVDAMPTGQARLVELARALATRPRLLLLDEPASGQDETETEAFGKLLTELAASGMAILLVEHDVPLVMRVCDQVSVLDYGAILATGTPQEIQQDHAVLEAYLGAAAEESSMQHAEQGHAEQGHAEQGHAEQGHAEQGARSG